MGYTGKDDLWNISKNVTDTPYFFQRGDVFLLAITCVWRLHWSVRRGTWSRVIKTGVDFIPLKFCGEPSCLALGVGALSGGARFLRL